MYEYIKEQGFFPLGRREKNGEINLKAPKLGWRWQSKRVSYDEAFEQSDYGSVGFPIPEGFTVIDIDNNEYGDVVKEILDEEGVNYACMQTTHGYHFWFKASDPEIFTGGTKVGTLLGIPVDSRLAGKNYVMVTVDFIEREWIVDTPAEDLDEIPYFLWFDFGKKMGNESPFYGLEEGSRNDTLFNYCNRLQSVRAQHYTELTDEEICNIIHLINSKLFAEPLGEDEVNKILRNGVLTPKEEMMSIVSSNTDIASGTPGKTRYFAGLKEGEKIDRVKAIEELDEHFGRCIVNSNNLYIYTDGYYSRQNETEQTADDVVDGYICRETLFVSARMRNELIRLFIRRHEVSRVQLNPDKNVLNMINGRYNTLTHSFGPHDPSVYETVRIPIEYDPSITEDKEMEEFRRGLFSLKDEKREIDYDGLPSIDLIDEISGYTFLRSLPADKGFLFYGPAGTGKSTYSRIIKRMVGSDNYSAVGVDIMASGDKNKFELALLEDMLLNTTEETSAKMISCEGSAILKDVVCDSSQNIQNKFEKSHKAQLFATQIHCINHSFDSRDPALWKRVIVEYFPTDYRDSLNRDVNILDKMTTARHLSYLFNRAMTALRRLQDNNFKFTTCEFLDDVRDEFHRDSPVEAFMSDQNMVRDDLQGKIAGELFNLYKTWCEKNNEKAMTARGFYSSIDSVFDAGHQKDTKGKHETRFFLK